MEKTIESKDFYQETLDFFERKIQNTIDKKISSLKPARDYTFSHSKAYEALKAFNEINKRYDISIFLVGGGLLGFIREGKLLEHDYDLDMGFLVDDISPIRLIKILKKEKNFKILSSSNDVVVVMYKDITIDLFGHKSINKDIVRFSTDIHYWDHEKFNLKKVDFLNTEVLIPSNPEKYLTEEYGDWQNRKIGFDFSYHSPNRGYNGLIGLIYLINRLENAVKNGWDSYASMAVSALYKNYNIDNRHIFPMPCVAHPADSLKEETIVYITNLDRFNINSIKDLKKHYEKDKNFVVLFLGEDDSTNKMVKIVSQLKFVTQVIVSKDKDLTLLEQIYPSINIVNKEWE